MTKIQLISGRSHPKLAEKISQHLNIKLTPVEIKNFADGEIYVRVGKKVRGNDVFVIQSICPPINENLVELLITIDSLRRASAGRINVVCPYLGYTRQDRKAVSREPITAKLVANLITKAGADRLITIDLHADQIQGFYDIPVDHFVGYPQFAKHLFKNNYENSVIVSPDIGAVKRCRNMARLINAPLVIVDKRRREHNRAEVMHVIGEVKGKNCVVVDDLIDTGGTVASVADILKKKGAKEIIICITHGLLSDNASEKLAKCAASKVYLLDTIPLPKEKKIAKMEVISLAPLLAKVIKRVHEGQSLGALFVWERKERIL